MTKNLKIVDEQGNLIQSLRCMARWKTFDENDGVTGSITWKEVKTENGFVKIDPAAMIEASQKHSDALIANGIELFFMADGYAPECVRSRFEKIPDKIVLEKPLRVYLVKQHETVPGKPVIVPQAHVRELLYQPLTESTFLLKVIKVGSDKWECQLKKGQHYIIGWKTNKGWLSKELEGYCSEAFTVEKEGQIVNFEPGLPVTFQYDLSKAPKFLNIRKYPVDLWLYRTVSGFGDEKFWFSQKATVEIKKSENVKIPGLAAGTYYLAAHNSPENLLLPHLSDRRKITIAPGKECIINPIYPTLDTTVEAGDVTIRGIVLDTEKQPIADEQVLLWMQKFDENKTLIVSDTFYEPAPTDARGRFEFTGVRPGQDIVLNLSNHSEGIFLARNSLKENTTIEVSFVVGQKDEFIAVGNPFAFPMVRLKDNEKKSLSEYKGRIIVIDLWASWCSPCLQSMPKLSELAEQIQSDNIKFITLSIDSDPQAWKKRLTDNNWPFLLHTWFDETINTFKLRHNGGIPFCIIIDPNGIVRAAGNEVDLKGEIEKIQKQDLAQ